MRYGIEVARLIFNDREWFDVRPDGVWTAEAVLNSFPSGNDVHWTPACDLGESGPDPLSTPGLPAPFNARELAAYLVFGPGAVVASDFGMMEGEPDAGMLERLGLRGTKARQAIKSAYAAFQRACRVVGDRPVDLEQAAQEAKQAHDRANEAANETVNLWAVGISDEERGIRRAQAKAMTADLAREADSRSAAADEQMSQWRRRVVKELLNPTIPPTLSAAIASRILLPFSCAADLIYDAQNPHADPFDEIALVSRAVDVADIQKRLRTMVEDGLLTVRKPGSGTPESFFMGAALFRTSLRPDEFEKAVRSEWPGALDDQPRDQIEKQTAPAFAERPHPEPASTMDQARRQADRYRACLDAGLDMPADTYSHLPRGIGKVAKSLKITRQALAQDVRAHIARLAAS
ncbi:Uncharacterised protein [Xylophilus ampelinus]|nr:Uncharacterised protein [Xylophilus ampelinus]